MTAPDYENLLRESIGLDVGSIGSSTLERAVKARMVSLGFEQSQCYWEYLQSSSDELQELIEVVVVPETWFFRDREAFLAIARLSSPWLAFPLGPPVRILSVPCCTGEEPYSIAIALVEAGLASARIQVDAVDVSRQAIIRAKRGVYGSNSFRGEDLRFRDRYFERSGNAYVIREWLRGLVTFYHENLFSPSFRIDAPPYDIVFCRNVLIYFDRTKQEAVMATLNRLLKADGYLFVGPAEAVLASRNGFRALNESTSFAFSKEQHHCVLKGQPTPTPPRANRRVSFPVSPKQLTAAIAGTVVEPTLESSRNGASSVDLEQIKNLADAGQFDEAVALCERYLDQKGHAFEVYYLLALINDAKGQSERAINCYRKALYLNPDHSDALTHLAFLYERQGEPVSAKRLRDRALRSEAIEKHNLPSGDAVSRSGP
ncbi:MAG: CheR family methyltransferase [Candidatus Acidiferrales bacterium]